MKTFYVHDNDVNDGRIGEVHPERSLRRLYRHKPRLLEWMRHAVPGQGFDQPGGPCVIALAGKWTTDTSELKDTNGTASQAHTDNGPGC